ncbi:4-alpha-glucanotransferase, partial [Hyphococcus sp.]|uniref:4-alpha-glucanotransferase n=1 Tax=Hyphococcus sp. TaxID=2038636 RepID=UPI0035C74C48
GIDRGFWGTDGSWHDTPEPTRRAIRDAMGADPDDERGPAGPPVWTVPAGWGEPLLGPCRLVLEDGSDLGVVTALPPDLPIGRHRLAPTDDGPTTLLLVRPRRCHRPPSRASALAVQAYAARSSRSWGIGDLADVAALGGWARAAGIDLLALSPLHAPAPGADPQPSPYYPASRRYRNPLHIAVDSVEGASRSDLVRRLGDQARALLTDRRIDRAAVWAAKLPALEHLFAAGGTAIDTAVEAYRAEQGADLEAWATYCTIAEVHPGSWQAWPTELRHPRSLAVQRFATAHADRVRFHCWLQWLLDRQVRDAAGACPVITDLAVGVDPGGADAWIDQDLLALTRHFFEADKPVCSVCHGIEIIAAATPKRHYYYQSAMGNRLFELGLGPVALALCGASGPDDQKLIASIESASPEGFAEAFLRARRLAWAADLITDNQGKERNVSCSAE